MNRYPRRLIEVDLPIKRISAHARREKSIRHGHISTLHIWWARRPLAACRAVILAALWPDPAPGPDDQPCPPAFIEAARTWMTDWAIKHAAKASKESFPRLMKIQTTPAILVEQPLELRNTLLDFIADFANWDNSTDKDYLETSRAIVQAAHEALGGAPGTRPLVVDPFAGGGSIPLEALRVGADAFASDLNPVAVLLNKVVLEYIPKYGQQLAEEVRKWGAWIKQEAEKELAEFYPKDPDGATPIAYLWARTIRCEGPGCGAEVPVIRSLWLAKRSSNSIALKMLPNPKRGEVNFEIITNAKPGDVAGGTVRRGSVTCPCCGYTTPADAARAQFKGRRGGAADARLLAVVTKRPAQSGRLYRVATESDLNAVRLAGRTQRDLESEPMKAREVFPDEPLPYLRSIFNINLLDVNRWKDLFSPRQLIAIATLHETLQKAYQRIRAGSEADLSDAVASCLALAVNRQADYTTSLCGWHLTRELIGHTYGRQALGIIWDFAEVCPFADGSGSFEGAYTWVAGVCDSVAQSHLSPGQVQCASATHHPIPDDSVAAFVTDPPYYDAVPYADLSDFFYVWLKRSLRCIHPDLFSQDLTPKREEIVQLAERNPVYAYKTKENFESMMTQALSEGRRISRPDGLGTVVFAHKTTSAWETMLQAVINAGWVIVASWPIDTEMGTRLRAMNSATLSSSVHLACRPRENPDGSVRTGDVGDWRDVLNELPLRIHDWMPRLRDEGVVGADAIFACLGPALEIFSRYSRVEKSSGDIVTLKEYLEQVWAAVSTEALSMIFEGADAAGLEPDARMTAMWLWTLGSAKTANGKPGAEEDEDTGDEEDDDDESSRGKKKPLKGFALEFDAARKIAQGLGIDLEKSSGIVEVKGDTARLLPVSERIPYLFGKDATAGPGTPKGGRRTKQRKLFEELEAVEAAAAGTSLGVGLTSRPVLGQTALDRVHQAMVLFGVNRGEALKQFLVDDGAGRDARFWTLAQSLSALYPPAAEEKRWVDGVLSRKKSLGF